MGKTERHRQFFWALGGFLFTVAAGTALHFFWKWTGYSRIAAAFSAVNESTWEHMKILFFPMFLFSMVQIWLQDAANFLAVRGFSVLIGTILIPVLHYTYIGATGSHSQWVDLAAFLISAAAVFVLDFIMRRTVRCSSGWQQVLGFAILWALALIFILWTYRPPNLALFQDPITGGMGLIT